MPLLHLPWEDAALLARRLAVVESALTGAAAQGITAALGDEDFREAVRSALQLLAPKTTGQNGVPRLHEYFLMSQASLEQAQPIAAIAPAAKPFRIALQARLTEGPCPTCNATKPCKGTPQSRVTDDANLAQVGACIRPLKEAFEYAQGLAASTYGGAQELELATDPLPGYPNHNLGIAFAAETLEGAPRHVVMRIHVNDFGLKEYAAAPYVLFHECFCHGYCGIPIASDTSEESDAFSEGWMDWVGLKLFRSALKSKAGLQTWGEIAPLLAQYASQVSARRIDCLATSSEAREAVYMAGWEAAEHLAMFMAGFRADEEAGFRLLADFSVRLNASVADDELRGDLVFAINDVLCTASDPYEALEAGQKWVQPVKQYQVSQDAEELAYRIVEYS